MDKKSWKVAVQATLHCLAGCLIGDLFGMSLGMLLGLSQMTTIILAIGFAFVFGYTFTIYSLRKNNLPFRKALGIAFIADTLSIGVMETVANLVVVMSGAMNHGFWASLLATLAGFVVAFIATVPVNKILISRGLGHAKAHEYHNHEHSGSHEVHLH